MGIDIANILIASEVDARVDSGDVVVYAKGMPKLRLTNIAAEALVIRINEAVLNNPQHPKNLEPARPHPNSQRKYRKVFY